MKRYLFIDRDGTLIVEPPVTYQIDSPELLEFLPGCISNLARLVKETDFELVMVTNQDGLGTASFPEETFWPAHNLMLRVLASEGIKFKEILIDRSFAKDGLATRKPGLGLVESYVNEKFDRDRSFVIGDRLTDVQFAKNLGIRSVFLGSSAEVEADYQCGSWEEIYSALRFEPRAAHVSRKTKETEISVSLNLDGTGKSHCQTGIGFFDHMLDQIAYHGMFDLEVNVKGDLHIDEHHTIEDTGIALGEAVATALGNKFGVYRYGFVLPMDEAEARVSVDFSGRPWFVWNAKFSREKIGEMPTEMFSHFFKSFTDAAKCTLHITVEGENEHHKAESIFKGTGRAIRFAIERDPRRSEIPSTKGIL